MAKSLFNPNSLTASFLRLNEQTPAPSGGVASRTLLQTGGGKSLVFSFDAGQELSEHTNPNHAILCGLTGTVEVTAGADVHQLGPGDMLHLPPKLPHRVKAAEAASFQLQLLAPDPAL